MRIGIGYDSHRFVAGRKFIIGGIEIKHPMGLLGHSDADVLVHAIIDALLGAAGLGDIGIHFPDNDRQWKDASSLDLLKRVKEKILSTGLQIQWIDAVIIAEQPKIAPYRDAMRSSIASVLGIDKEKINIKAKTNEGMGFVGRGEGIAAQAVCLLA
jgi:2-C-methyl-D-erythritol 2,4-cyclodiphosphate synthase